MRRAMLGLIVVLAIPAAARAADQPATTPPPDANGVIHPPAHVDPGINAPRPAVGAPTQDPMNVMPPAGAAGSNPAVVPK